MTKLLPALILPLAAVTGCGGTATVTGDADDYRGSLASMNE
jgi:hypothetical protein